MNAVEACVLVVSILIHYLEFTPAPSLCVLQTWIESLHILPQGNTLIIEKFLFKLYFMVRRGLYGILITGFLSGKLGWGKKDVHAHIFRSHPLLLSLCLPQLTLLSQNFTVLSQIKTIASFFKIKISDFQTRFHDE